MGLLEAKGGLNKSLKDLIIKWQNVRGDWNDEVSDRFEETYIQPLEMAIKQAVSAMDQSSQLIHRVDNECK